MHTFKLITQEGRETYIKWHWVSQQGAHSFFLLPPRGGSTHMLSLAHEVSCPTLRPRAFVESRTHGSAPASLSMHVGPYGFARTLCSTANGH